jgi:hypothetical protein
MTQWQAGYMLAQLDCQAPLMLPASPPMINQQVIYPSGQFDYRAPHMPPLLLPMLPQQVINTPAPYDGQVASMPQIASPVAQQQAMNTPQPGRHVLSCAAPLHASSSALGAHRGTSNKRKATEEPTDALNGKQKKLKPPKEDLRTTFVIPGQEEKKSRGRPRKNAVEQPEYDENGKRVIKWASIQHTAPREKHKNTVNKLRIREGGVQEGNMQWLQLGQQ